MILRVFVYGTLKPGGYYWPQFCEGKVTAHETAKVRGALYDLRPGYPALLEGDGWVHGTVLTLKDDAALRGFDTLEGYEAGRAPADNEYQRCEVDAFSPAGEPLGRVWTYFMLPDKMRELDGIHLPEGAWDRPLVRE